LWGGQGYALGAIGNAYHLKGDPGRGREYLERAVAIVREAGQRQFEARFLWYLGHAEHALGHAGQALESWRRALEIPVEGGLITAEQAGDLLATPVGDLPQDLDFLQ
jgi:tetratricopeptide (TPR) repeat protein